MADPTIEPNIKLVSVFISPLPATNNNSLVREDPDSDILIPRRTNFAPFLSTNGLVADIAYAVSSSPSHSRASAYFTSDDDARGGVSFTLDGIAYAHRYYGLVPGTVGIHSSATSLVALHEFGHALSSYSNGTILDLYVDGGIGVNKKSLTGQPSIPINFSDYNGSVIHSDQTRGPLGYPPGWQTYYSASNAPPYPAIMDNFWAAPGGASERCEHDQITRRFLYDRVYAKTAR